MMQSQELLKNSNESNLRTSTMLMFSVDRSGLRQLSPWTYGPLCAKNSSPNCFSKVRILLEYVIASQECLQSQHSQFRLITTPRGTVYTVVLRHTKGKDDMKGDTVQGVNHDPLPSPSEALNSCRKTCNNFAKCICSYEISREAFIYMTLFAIS